MEFRFKTRADELLPTSVHPLCPANQSPESAFWTSLLPPCPYHNPLSKPSAFCLHFATVTPCSPQGLPRILLLGHFPNGKGTASPSCCAEDSCCRAASVAWTLQGHLWSSDPKWEESHTSSNTQCCVLETSALSCRDSLASINLQHGLAAGKPLAGTILASWEVWCPLQCCQAV